MHVNHDHVAYLILVALALLVLFFVTRPEVWARLWFAGIDPRPAALMRIGLGLAALWTFMSLTVNARRFFTDEGIFLTSMARARYGGGLDHAWDPAHGFEHWWSALQALTAVPTILHLRSDPALVFTIYGLLMVSLSMMVLGAWTRWTTIVSWLLAEQLYRYNSLFYMGGDYVIRAFLFLGMLSRWGEAYSIDSWRRSRAAIASGADEIPAPGPVPAWPFRIMMVQLACIYATAGLTKTGSTWSEGTALYYALNLEHFYRVPAQGVITWLQWSGFLPLLTWTSRWWEILFPLALLGAALRGYEADRASGVWPTTPATRRWLSYGFLATLWLIVSYLTGLLASRYLDPATLGLRLEEPFFQGGVSAIVALGPLLIVAIYRWLRDRRPKGLYVVLHWVLGKRVWLGFGLLVHIGIDIGLNIGTFSQIMIATYLCWLSGSEVDAFWRYVYSSALKPGDGVRPRRRGVGLVLTPLDRLRYRGHCPAYTVSYHPDAMSIRKAAVLRIWDVGNVLRFTANPTVPSGTIRLDIPRGTEDLQRRRVDRAVIAIFPALWWLSPASWIPGLSRLTGRCALRVLGLSVALSTAATPMANSTSAVR